MCSVVCKSKLTIQITNAQYSIIIKIRIYCITERCKIVKKPLHEQIRRNEENAKYFWCFTQHCIQHLKKHLSGQVHLRLDVYSGGGTHVENVMKNWRRSNLGCCEKEMMTHIGVSMSYTYT